jgi:tetratricopeptide (TPR) repeat protein
MRLFYPFYRSRRNFPQGALRQVAAGSWSRRPESNRDLALRRRSFYPLNYGEAARILRDGPSEPKFASLVRVSETVRELFAAADRLQAEDDPEAAEVLLRRAVQMAPDAAEAHGRLGIALRALERFDDAVAEFDTAAECDPGLAAPHSEAGFTLAAAGRPAEAVARYRRALELKPEQPEVRWNLALLLQLGQY